MQNRTAHLHPSFWGFASTLCTLGFVINVVAVRLNVHVPPSMMELADLAFALTPVLIILGIVFGAIGIICDRKRIFAITGLMMNSVTLILTAVYIFSLAGGILQRVNTLRETSPIWNQKSSQDNQLP